MADPGLSREGYRPEEAGPDRIGDPDVRRSGRGGSQARYGEEAYWRHVREEADRLLASGPSDDEVEAWAERERQRRREWAEGPTEHEKLLWARRERLRRARKAERPSGAGGSSRGDPDRDDQLRRAARFRRDAQRLALGTFATLLDLPFLTASTLVGVGRDVEAGADRPARRRVSLVDDEFESEFLDDDVA